MLLHLPMKAEASSPDHSPSKHHEWLWFRAITKPLMPHYREALFISFFTNLLALSVPLFTLQVYDRVVSHNATSTLAALTIGIALALLFDFVLRQARSRLLQRVALYIDAWLGRALYEKIAQLPLRTLEDKPTSFWQSLFADIGTLRAVLSGPTAMMMLDIPFALLFLLVIVIIAPAVAWLVVLLIPLFLAVTLFASRAQAKTTFKETGAQQHREAMLAELLAGRSTVKALMIDRAQQPRFETLHAQAIRQAFLRGAEGDVFIAFGQTLSQLATVLLVSVGALAIIDRELTTGALIATTMLTSRIVSPLNQLLATWKSLASARQSARRLQTVFGYESERQVPSITRERPKGTLTIDHVVFHYDEHQAPVVNNVALQMGPGMLVGILGKNGCGKSTLLKLIQGLYTPSKGRILLDDADIQQFSRTELASWIGYVPQECILFQGSIKANITMAYPEASDEQILQAAKWAGADGFISRLSQGYDTLIGESGHTLSGGQRQKIAIARALLRNPAILLFDEVSSHLDHQSERELKLNLKRLCQDRTIIMVTHSPPLLMACDRLIVMEQGQVLMAGPAAQVLTKLTGTPPTEPSPAGRVGAVSASQGDAS